MRWLIVAAVTVIATPAAVLIAYGVVQLALKGPF